MIEPLPIRLQVHGVASGPDLSVPAPIFCGAEILQAGDELYWSVLDIVVETQSARPCERRLRLWRIDFEANEARQLPDQCFFFPSGDEISYIIHSQQFLAFVADNHDAPAKFLHWDLPSASFRELWSGLQRPPIITNCSLPPEVAWRVKLSPSGLWSTIGIPPETWAFNPRLRLESGRLTASLDTADGNTGIMEMAPQTGMTKAIGLPLFRAVEPVLARFQNHLIMLARQPDERWSGYFDNPKLSFTRGPVALPTLVGLVEEGKPVVEYPQGLSGISGVSSYAFDVTTRPNGQQVFGQVMGDREQPMLFIYRSLDDVASISVPLRILLKGQVARLHLIATDTQISICVVYRVNAQFRVDFYHRAFP